MGTFSPSITTGLFLADHTVVSLSWGLNLFILAVDSLGDNPRHVKHLALNSFSLSCTERLYVLLN